MNVYLPNGRLPSAYQEVEYIESDRSVGQYIHTNIIPVSNTGLYLKASSQNITNDGVYVGAATNSSDTGNKYGLGGTQSTIYYGYNHWLKQIYRPSATLDTVFELELNYKNSGVFKKDGITYTGDSATTIGTLNTIGYPLNIFGHNGAGTAQYFSSIKLYNLKITSGSNIIADFIPCYRKSDSVIGLYDLVNNQFYTNSGTGTFSKGNDVTMAELKNAYIGEVYEYSINFKDYSNISQVQALGWTFEGASGAVTPAVNNTYGLYNSNYQNDVWWCEGNYPIPGISTASKITISLSGYGPSSVNNAGHLLIGLTIPQSGGFGTPGLSGFFQFRGNANDSILLRNSNSDVWNQNIGSATAYSGQCTLTLEIDFVNKLVTYKSTGKNKTGTHALSDSDITLIKTFTHLAVVLNAYNASAINNQIWSVGITIK